MVNKTRHIVKVQSKNGSLYIHLPKEIVKKWHLSKGDYVEILFDDSKATIRKI